jgi:TonB family protein
VFKVVDVMPRFPGCEDSGLTGDELFNCSVQKMLDYVYAQIKYPEAARKHGITGRVVAQFIVTADGRLTGAEVIKPLGYGTDEIVLEVIHSMPTWRPGYHQGKPVAVEMTLPVTFKLQGQSQVDTLSIDGTTNKIVVTSIAEPKTDSEIYKIVDEMPRFPGCEDTGLEGAELNNCSQRKLLEYIYANLVYPKEAKEKKITGRAIAQFVVRKNGSISDVTILRSIGYGTDAAIIALFPGMPAWRPGYHEGKAVDVQFTLPVIFKLPEE